MTAYAALLRAVNVGGTGKLPMADLKALAEAAGLKNVRTYIASGNLLFESGLAETAVRTRLETALADYAGRPVGVLVRTLAELAAVVANNPFRDEPGSRVVVLFLDQPPPSDAAESAKNRTDERIARGARELYVHYPSGQGQSRLVLPAAKTGTGRNMNTVAQLVERLGG